MNVISKETFKEATPDVKLDILFDYNKNIYKLLSEQPGKCESKLKSCDARFKKLERRKL